MLELSESQVKLAATPANKSEAIQQVAGLLVGAGNMDPRYVDSMYAREQVANTFLANGIAIPHGMPEDREYILKTGIAVLQIPAGVEWNEGEIATLVVGIAASSGEHLGILRNLTGVVTDELLASKLSTTTDKFDIIEALTGSRPATTSAAPPADLANSFEIVIKNPTGLHARPATELVMIAKKYKATIKIRLGEVIVEAKSLVNILKLGAGKGATITVSADGEDAQAALDALKKGIDSGLGEELGSTHELHGDQFEFIAESDPICEGVSASSGIVVGPISQHTYKEIVVPDSVVNPSTGAKQFQKAIADSINELNNLFEEVKKRLGSGQASIFLVHAEFLQDEELIAETQSLIAEKHNPGWAWQQCIRSRVEQLQKVDDPVMAGRAIDMSDVGQRVLRHLLGITSRSSTSSLIPSILVAEDLTPSDTANLDGDLILGFVTAKGGPTSHTAIIARAMGIPAIVAAGDQVLDLVEGGVSILDGFSGRLYASPSDADILSAKTLAEEYERQLDSDRTDRALPATTKDGHNIEVFANVNRVADAKQAIEYGAEGVGLMRTEFLFLESGKTPSEDEQYAVYRDMALALGGAPLTIRTLDIGGDKLVPHLNLPKEDNSFLGIRGIRLCFAREDLFIPQLRAIYRAAKEANIRVMFPMISTIDDIEMAIEATEKVRVELNAPKIEIGIMVEVPSAAVMADMFAEYVDFFSIGTNDLTQYTLAMDRVHPALAKQADALNPAVLRMIDITVKAATKAGKWVAVCGGSASDLRGAAILAGLGVKELSVTVPTIPSIKASLRNSNISDLRTMAKAALNLKKASEVRAL